MTYLFSLNSSLALCPTMHLTKSQSPLSPTQSHTTIPVLPSPTSRFDVSLAPSANDPTCSVSLCLRHKKSTIEGFTFAATRSGQQPGRKKLLALRKLIKNGFGLADAAAFTSPGRGHTSDAAFSRWEWQNLIFLSMLTLSSTS